MKTLDIIIDILNTQENNQLEHKGRYIDLHSSKRVKWNNRRNYGL